MLGSRANVLFHLLHSDGWEELCKTLRVLPDLHLSFAGSIAHGEKHAIPIAFWTEHDGTLVKLSTQTITLRSRQ